MSFTDAELTAQLPYLGRLAKRFTFNRDDAEDLVQDTAFRAIRARESFMSGTNLRGWLSFIMRNLWISQKRRAKFTGETYEGAEYDLPAAVDLDACIELRETLEALACLPAAQREAILAIADGASIEDAAEALGVEVGTVKSRVSRGRDSLHLYFAA